MPKLIIKKGHYILKKLAVPDDLLAFTVGSEQGNDIIINENSISFFHLQFEKQTNQYYVRDLQSQTGTFVNGNRIAKRTVVANNDEIGIGNHSITFMDNGNPRAPQTENTRLNFRSNRITSLKSRTENVPALDRLNAWLDTEESLVDEEPSDDVLQQIEENTFNSAENLEQPDNSDNMPESQTDPKLALLEDVTHSNMILESEPAGTDTGPINEEDRFKTKRSQDTKISNTFDKSNHYLLGIYGYYVGRKFRIKSGITRIGRDENLNDIVIANNSNGELDKSVSRRQASLRCKDNSYILLDKRSQSRTALNRIKFARDEHLPMSVGDEIEIESDKKNHIFRMVENGNWDFSFPKKTGPWHVRNRNRIVKSCSAIVIGFALLVFLNSARNSYIITSAPGKLAAEDKLWQTTPVTTPSNGKPLPNSFPATADLDKDGYTDLLLVDDNGQLTCFSGREKKVLWTANDFQALASYPITIGDLHNDQQPDVVVISNDLRIRAMDGKWGLEIWKSPILPGPLTGPAVMADLNGDALHDVAVASQNRALYLGYSGTKSARWQKINLPDIPTAALSAVDLDGDATASIVVGTESGLILVVDCRQGKILTEINVGEELSKATGQYFRNNKILGPIGVADLNGDGTQDLLIITVAGHMLALNGDNMQRLWFNILPERINSHQRFAPIALGDFDGDQQADVVAITPQGRIQAFKGAGQGGDRKMMLWQGPTNSNSSITGIPVIADFNKNGTDDIIVTDTQGQLLIFEGSDGDLILTKSLGKHPPTSQPLIADFNNDNSLDVLVLDSEARLHVLHTNRNIPAGSIIWGQTFGNSQHTLHASFTEPKSNKYYLYMVGALLAILSAVWMQIQFNRSRNKLSDYT